MSAIAIPAHFDGERIVLDESVRLEVDAKLLVTVLPKDDDERNSWMRLSMQRLDAAYTDDEPEYGLDSVKETNSEYAGR